MTRPEPVTPEFYDRAYFTDGTKSNYAPYGPGAWADHLANMVSDFYAPASVLDVGCAYGFVVKRLAAKGIPAYGFDLSQFAVEQAHDPNVWVGDAASIDSYRAVDLVLATELPEHLTPAQSRLFLSHARKMGNRALLLIAAVREGEEMPDMAHEKDLSHINIQPMRWWLDKAIKAGWRIGDSDRINSDPRSQGMSWHGRFLYLTKE